MVRPGGLGDDGRIAFVAADHYVGAAVTIARPADSAPLSNLRCGCVPQPLKLDAVGEVRPQAWLKLQTMAHILGIR